LATERPTILQIIPRLDTGGAELSALEITEAIARAGGRALVATEGGRLERGVVQAGGEIVRMPAGTKNPLRMLSNALALQRLVRSENIDLLHARSRAPAWSALLAARRASVPFVTTYHGAYAERGMLKRVYNSVMVRSDVVIANSGYTRDLICRRYVTSGERISVIHRGIDPAQFDPAAITQDRASLLRRQWGVTADARIILHPARLTGWKGQMTVIEAAGMLHADGRLAEAVVILAGDAQGRDDYAQKLRVRIAALELTDRVKLVGHVEDMPAACGTAYITVVASTEPEAFGRVAIEAQAMGSPVIATGIGAPPETVLAGPAVPKEQMTGWLTPPGDARALADALAAALSVTAEQRVAIGRRARLHVLEDFTLEAMKRRTLEVYDRLLGSHLAARFAEMGPPVGTEVRLDLAGRVADS
jgi:glycosyltransferase involved in cell wall biosynthesis